MLSEVAPAESESVAASAVVSVLSVSASASVAVASSDGLDAVRASSALESCLELKLKS